MGPNDPMNRKLWADPDWAYKLAYVIRNGSLSLADIYNMTVGEFDSCAAALQCIVNEENGVDIDFTPDDGSAAPATDQPGLFN